MNELYLLMILYFKLCMLGNFFTLLCHQNRKNYSGRPSEWQTVWIQIRPDKMLGLIWVQIVCKGYQETTLVGKELEKISKFKFFLV